MQSQEKLQSLKEHHHVTKLGEQQSIMLKQIAAVRDEFDETLTQEVAVENRIAKLKRQLVSIPKTIPQAQQANPNEYLISSLEARLIELQIEEKKLLIKYTEDNRLVKDVRQRINMVTHKLADQEKKRYGRSSTGVNVTHQRMEEELLRNEADMKALSAKRQALKVRLAAYEDELEQLNRIELTHNQLEQEVSVNMENFRLYLAKFEESRISNAMDTEKMANVSLIEPARAPLKPVSPKVLLNLVLSVFLGGFGGLGLALFLEYLDDSLEKIEDVEEYLKVPVLASIPEFKS